MRAQRLAAAAAATVLFSAAPAGSPAAAAAVTGLVMTSPPAQIAAPDPHSAFPGAALAPDGTLVVVFRGGTSHTSGDGRVRRVESRDRGQTWSTATTVPVPVSPGQDLRDPYIAYLRDAAGQVHEYLTYFVATATNAAAGAYVIVDGGTPVRIDPNLPYAAVSGPVVRMPDGRLATAFYGRQGGETVDTAWVAVSANQGASWTSNRVLNAIGAGIPTPEPWLVVDGATVHLFARWGTYQIAQRSTQNSAASWDTARVTIVGCTGRPSATVTAAGTVVMVCRDARGGSWGGAQTAYSLDHTAHWAWGPRLGGVAGQVMTYAAPVEVLSGVVAVPFAIEESTGTSGLYRAFLAESVS